MARAGDERDLDAAERALGTLSRDGESDADSAMRERWEMRFAALGAVIPPVAPPPGLYRGIQDRIALEGAIADLEAERRKRRGWRNGALMMTAIAASLVLAIALPREMLPAEMRTQLDALLGTPAPNDLQLVATVTHDDNPLIAGMIVHVDVAAGTATIVPTRVTAPEGRAYEVWHIAEGGSMPRSLGLLPESPVTMQSISAGPGDIFTISEEPPGGSPDGSPTTLLFRGTMVAAR
ncbi:MAG: anti-sigma factor [Pseudomonadota bacterium]